MGMYTYIKGQIYDTDIDDVVNYLADRYSGLVVKEKWDTPDRGELVLFPIMNLCSYEQKNGSVTLYGSVKWKSYDYGLQHVLGFSAIEDACRDLGNSVLEIENEMSQKTNTRRFPPKERKPYPPRTDVKQMESARLAFYFTEHILGIKDAGAKPPEGGLVIPTYVYTVHNYVYAAVGKFLRSRNPQDMKAYYNILQLCMQLAAEEKPYDIPAITAETFSKELNRLPQCKLFVFNDTVTRQDLEGLSRVFEAAGNGKLAQYCQSTAEAVDRFYEICRRVRDINGRVTVRGNLPNFTAEGIKNHLSISKDYGWGFRNFASVSLQVTFDNSGTHIDENERRMFESCFFELDYPHAAQVMGWYISDKDIEEGLARPDIDNGRAHLLGHLYRSRRDSLGKIFPGVIDEKRLFLERKRELAEQFWVEFGIVELNVPYREKEAAKKAGARWNGESKHWVMNRKDALEHADSHWIPDWFRPVFDGFRSGSGNGSPQT